MVASCWRCADEHGVLSGVSAPGLSSSSWNRLAFVVLVVASIVGCSSTHTTAPPAPPSATFRGVGDLPGGDFHSEALAISDDGRVVVGRSTSAFFTEEGFRLVEGDTLTALLGQGGLH